MNAGVGPALLWGPGSRTGGAELSAPTPGCREGTGTRRHQERPALWHTRGDRRERREILPLELLLANLQPGFGGSGFPGNLPPPSQGTVPPKGPVPTCPGVFTKAGRAGVLVTDPRKPGPHFSIDQAQELGVTWL